MRSRARSSRSRKSSIRRAPWRARTPRPAARARRGGSGARSAPACRDERSSSLLCRRPALLAGGALGVAIAPVPGPSPVRCHAPGRAARPRGRRGRAREPARAGDVVDEAAGSACDRAKSVVVGSPRSRRGRRAPPASATSASIAALAVETLASPGRGEVAPLDQRPTPPGAAPRADRRRGPSGTPCAGARAARLRRDRRAAASNQRSKARSKRRPRDVLGRHLEQRIDAAPRPAARAAGRRRRRGSCRCARSSSCGSAPCSRSRSTAGARRVLPRALDRRAQPQLHLAGRRLGEGDRDDPVEACRAARQRLTMRPTSSVVLPVPAAASTTSVDARSVRMRSRAA